MRVAWRSRTRSALWQPDGIFLNSATYGLPPTPAWDAMQEALAAWRDGTGVWERWAEEVDRARRAFARIVACRPSGWPSGPAPPSCSALVAAALPDGARVLAAEGDFTSLLFPFATHAGRGVSVTTVPLDRLADSIGPDTAAVRLQRRAVLERRGRRPRRDRARPRPPSAR